MAYPVAFRVDRPEKLSRLTTFFRGFMAIPQLVVFVFVSVASYVIYFLAWWAILFTARYPVSFFKFVTWWFRWSARLGGYLFLLTDKYPPFTGNSEVSYPIAVTVGPPGRLSRLTSFLRFPVIPVPSLDPITGQSKISWTGGGGFPMSFPHAVVLAFLGIAAMVILFLSWWAIIFTARYPKAFFDYIAWYFRWSMRVNGYIYLLTDKYPPFSGAEQA